MLSYAAQIFHDSGSKLSPAWSSIVVGSMLVIGGYCSTSIIDRVGRKLLLLISCSGMSLSLVVLGVFCSLNFYKYDVKDYSIVAVISLSSFIFMSVFGIIPVPYVIMSEVVPYRLRPISNLCSCMFALVCLFVVMKCFPILVEVIELHNCIFILGVISALGSIFVAIAVPETKGKNLNM